jgi:hypothetical protein
VSPTVRRITVSQPLPPGEYAILPKPTTAETSRSAFLFEVR